MKKFRNKKETKKVGLKVKLLREAAGHNIADIADMTGFSHRAISGIEKGAEATVSYIIEIAKAIGVSPKEIFDIKFDKQPRFKLSPQRKERSKLTQRVMALYETSDFFLTPRFVRDVEARLNESFTIKDSSIQISVALSRMEKIGLLKANKIGRQKQYYKKRKAT